MELELTKTEKILAIAMISLVAFLILRSYYSKKKIESSYKQKVKPNPATYNVHNQKD